MYCPPSGTPEMLLQSTLRIIQADDWPSFKSWSWMGTWYTLAFAIQHHLETDSLVTDNRLCQLCKQGCVVVVLRALVQLRWPCCSQFLRAENRLYGYRISGPWRESDHGPVILSWREPIIVRTHLPNATSIRKLGTLRVRSGYLCIPNGGRLRSDLPVLRYQEYDGGADMFYK